MGCLTSSLNQSGYLFDPGSKVWSRSGFQEIPYCDGEDVERHIREILLQTKDHSVLSDELSRHCTDWPTRYHLSASRANLLRPFDSLLSGDILEVGAGCGAITRYLGESGASVIAIEGSLTRASISRERTSDLGNVTVLAENMLDLDLDVTFDLITLIGVFEYAHVFSISPTAATDLLQKVRRFLKPQGKLILAIENRLGLKYFAGAPEDHVGLASYGLEDQYTATQPRTYGKEELLHLLKKSGYTSTSLLFPFPDYKFPTSILAEDALGRNDFDATAFAWQTVHDDRQMPALPHFSPELVWRAIGANGLLHHLANSFLLVASGSTSGKVHDDALAFHFSTRRRRQYCKQTLFRTSTEGTGIEVVYRRMDTSGGHAKRKGGFLQFTCPRPAAYIHGELLSWRFIRMVSQDGWSPQAIGDFLRQYLQILKEWVGDPLEHGRVPGKFIDAGPQNIIIDSRGRPFLIDTEWSIQSPIETGWLLWRSLFHLLHKVTRFGIDSEGRPEVSSGQFLREALLAAGFTFSCDDLARFARMEAELLEQVTGIPLTNREAWPENQVLPTHNTTQWIAQLQDGYERSANTQVFWQTEEAFVESSSIRSSWPPDGREHPLAVRFPHAVHGQVRIDPAEASCLMVFSSLSVETPQGNVENLAWPPALATDDVLLLSSGNTAVVLASGHDPSIVIDLPEKGASALSWRACKIPLTRTAVPQWAEALGLQLSNLDRMQTELTDKSHTVTELEETVQHQSAQTIQLRTDLEDVQQHLDVSERQRNQSEEALELLAQSIQSREDRIVQLEHVVGEQEQQLLSLEETTGEIRRMLASRDQTLRELSTSESRLRTGISEAATRLESDIERCNARLEEQGEEARQNLETIDPLRQHMARQEGDITSAHAESEAVNAMLRAMLESPGWQFAQRAQRLFSACLPPGSSPSRLARHAFRTLRRLKCRHAYRLIRHSGLFDSDWYRGQNPGEAARMGDPIWHYLEHGAREGRNPSPDFDGNAYLHMHPDVAAANANPLAHYLSWGEKEGRTAVLGDSLRLRRSRFFDANWYRRVYPDIAKAKIDPIAHYLAQGAKEGREPGPEFSTRWYLRMYPDVAAAGINPLVHFLTHGRREGRLPRSPRAMRPGVLARACLWLREVYRRLPIRTESRTRHRAFVARHFPWVIRHLRKPGTASLYPRVPGGPPEARVSEGRVRRLVLVSHAASRTGAPMLALHLAQSLFERQKLKLAILILENGELASEFARYGEVFDVSDSATEPGALDPIAQTLYQQGYRQAICNTVLSGPMASSLKAAGLTVTVLVHEMGSSIREHHWVGHAQSICRNADTLVFPSTIVRDSFVEVSGRTTASMMIRPQGNYLENTQDRETARKELRRRLSLPPDAFIVLGMGYADRRKGIDTFVETGILLQQHQQRVVFVWVGAIDPYSEPVLRKKLAAAPSSKNIHLIGPTNDPTLFHAGSDLLLLTSRADPFPTVVMEAMDAGLPVVGWRSGGGFVDLLNAVGGVIVRDHSAKAFAKALEDLLDKDERRETLGRRGREVIRNEYRFADYADALTALACLQPRTISVIVPNYNYAEYLPERFASIAAQTYPIHEIIVLDDASSDRSVEVIQQQLEKIPVPHRLVINAANAGTFAQWQRGIEMARGELVWIAEADDSCEPQLLANLVPFFDHPKVGLAYAQSIILDGHGAQQGTYLEYLEADGEPESRFRWRHAFVQDGQQEIRNHLVIKNTLPNVSAVLMRRETLLLLEKPLGAGMRTSGDWHTYINLLEHCSIAYCPSPLNLHRCHDRTIVARQRGDSREASVRLIRESIVIQHHARTRYAVGKRIAQKARTYLQRVAECNLLCRIEDIPEVSSELERLDRIAPAVDPKRILFFSTNDNWGGSEFICSSFAKGFAEQGFRVALCMRSFATRPSILQSILDDATVLLHERPPLDEGLSNTTQDFCLSFEPDLVFLSNGHAFEGLDMMQWCLNHTIPYVNYIPLPNEEMSKFHTAESIDECAEHLKRSCMLFFDHQAAHSLMNRMFNTRFDSFRVVRNPVNVPYQQEFEWHHGHTTSTIFGYFGRLERHHKGLDILLDVLQQPQWRGREFQFHVYGSGPDRDWFVQELQNRRIRCVVLKGHTDDMERALKSVQIVALPSRLEGTPGVLVESLLCGRPAIVTPVGGMKELVEDGINGFVAKEPTAQAFEDCMERAWECRGDWPAMGRTASEQIRRIFPENPHAACIEAVTQLLHMLKGTP